MRVTLTGIKHETWTDKQTGKNEGRKTIYFQCLNAEPDVDGYTTGSYTLSSKGNRALYEAPLAVGNVYNIFTEGRSYNGSAYTVVSEILDEKFKPVTSF